MRIEEIERRLAQGEVDAEMELYFGPQLGDLLRLARAAEGSTRSTRGARPKALVLPGIMGSTLGYRPVKWLPYHNLIWLDPLDTVRGFLNVLAIPSQKNIVALDPFPLVYLGMRLALQSAGFDAEYFPFDWRLNLKVLGKALKDKLATMGPGKVHLAAHSMGGLVARAALQQGASNIGTVVMMGTPNRGSYSPVQAFRGVHDLASKIAGIDLTHTSLELTEKVFSTFPGLAQMLPLEPIANGLDWHAAGIWPASPRIRPDVLKEADNVEALLAPPGPDWHLIAGIHQRTIIRAERNPDGGLRYRESYAGDGTVPLASARIAEVRDRTYFVEHAHGTLTMNKLVQRAVVELFRGETNIVLSKKEPAIQADPPDWITEPQMATRAHAAAAIRSTRVVTPTVSEAAERLRRVLATPLTTGEQVATPLEAAAELRAPTAAGPALRAEPTAQGYVVSRETQLYLEIELVHGDIAQVESEAIVLPKFQNMDLGSAAQSVDACMDGVLADLMQRRMFTANVGEIFALPAARHAVRTDLVVLAGLGPMDGFLKAPADFAWETFELVAENVLRTLLSAGVTEFATILFAHLSDAGPGVMQRGLAHLMQGFLRGLTDVSAHERRRFRRVSLCESDPVRFQNLREALHGLLRTELFDAVKVRLDERVLPPPSAFDHRSMAAGAAGVAGRDPAYLFVRGSRVGREVHFETTFASPRGRAATFRETQRVAADDLQAALDLVKPSSWDDSVSLAEVAQAGTQLAALVLHPIIRDALVLDGESPLILVHDEEASRIPWETLRLGADGELLPACAGGLSRQYAASDLSIAKWREERRRAEKLSVLLIVNPTGDLDGAKDEGQRIRAQFAGSRDVELKVVEQAEATRPRLLELFRSGKFDVVHYAGHAFFDPDAPERSGILCAPKNESDPSVLSGADLAGLGQLPMLVFFNACESARVRGGANDGKPKKHPDRVRGMVSFAEAFMRGGVASFVGTYWPVGDAAATTFATSFYESILLGHPLGSVVTTARQALHKTKTADWADYLHYGSPNFILKPRRE